MTTKYDVIVIGGGHNGLTCAAYLARAGRRVLVLEQRDVLGGAAVTEEIFPGFKYTVFSYVVSLLRPEVIRELELPKHGLQIHPIDSVFAPTEDGDYIVFPTDPAQEREEIKRHSVRDAEMMPRFTDLMYKMAHAVKPILGYTPPDPNRQGWKDLRTARDLGKHMSSLDRQTFAELTKLMTMSADDFLAEYFETDLMRATVGLSGIIGTMLGLKSPGTAYVLLHHYMGELDGAYTAWGAQKGGTGAVSEAIAGAARLHGADIRLGEPVANVRVRNGSAVGVVTDRGEEIDAEIVVSGCDPRVTFRQLVDESELPEDLIDAIDNFKYRGSSGKVNLALERLPTFTSMPDPSLMNGSIAISPSVDYIEQAYDDAKYGGISRRPAMEVEIPTTVDPTMAPPGKHVLSAFVQYASYESSSGVDPVAVATGDLDADGFFDLAISDRAGDQVRLRFNDDFALFPTETVWPLTVGDLPGALVVGDVLAGGGTGIAVSTTGSAMVRLVDPAVGVTSSLALPGLEPLEVHAVDLNGGGNDDLVVVLAGDVAGNAGVAVALDAVSFTLVAPPNGASAWPQALSVAFLELDGANGLDLAVAIEPNAVTPLPAGERRLVPERRRGWVHLRFLALPSASRGGTSSARCARRTWIATGSPI